MTKARKKEEAGIFSEFICNTEAAVDVPQKVR